MISIEPIPVVSWLVPINQFVLNNGRQKAEEIVRPWMSGSKIANIDTFNDASISLFIDFTGDLEGYKNTDGTGSGSRWKNLPYWLSAIWLPLNGQPMIPTVLEIDNEPIMIGTATGLRRDLDEIRSMSKALKFGSKPQLFDLMHSDPKAFYANTTTFTETEMLEWIWYAYSFAADKAVAVSLPAWQGG